MIKPETSARSWSLFFPWMKRKKFPKKGREYEEVYKWENRWKLPQWASKSLKQQRSKAQVLVFDKSKDLTEAAVAASIRAYRYDQANCVVAVVVVLAIVCGFTLGDGLAETLIAKSAHIRLSWLCTALSVYKEGLSRVCTEKPLEGSCWENFVNISWAGWRRDGLGQGLVLFSLSLSFSLFVLSRLYFLHLFSNCFHQNG